MKKVKKRLKTTKFEKLLYTFTFVMVATMPLSLVFATSTLSKINFEVEKSKKEIAYQTKKNESVNMKINELVSLDKIQEIAKEFGLSYNNDNIKTIKD